MHARTCSSVVFPLPLRPMIRPRLLGGTSMDTSCTQERSAPSVPGANAAPLQLVRRNNKCTAKRSCT
eukprot:scaffold96995_cov21-Tisochrysis_lutea.AAC.1